MLTSQIDRQEKPVKRSIAIAAVLLLSTVAASADTPLTKYKNWGESPEAYFLTPEEQTAWSAVVTDEAAETFVSEFRARRGGEAFTKELKTRVDNADKYLTIGKVKGSATLRGKAVILFGAPVNIAVIDREAKRSYSSAPSAAVSDLGTGATAASGDGDTQKIGGGQAGRVFRDFTFTFSAKQNPFFGAKDYVVTIEADAGTGKDKLGKGTKQEELDAHFKAAAEASIKQ